MGAFQGVQALNELGNSILILKDHIHWAGYHVDVDTGVGFIGKRTLCSGEKVSLWARGKEDVAVMSSDSLLQFFKDKVEAFH